MTHGCDLLAKQLVLALHVPKSVHQSHFNKANVTQLSLGALVPSLVCVVAFLRP